MVSAIVTNTLRSTAGGNMCPARTDRRLKSALVNADHRPAATVLTAGSSRPAKTVTGTGTRAPRRGTYFSHTPKSATTAGASRLSRE